MVFRKIFSIIFNEINKTKIANIDVYVYDLKFDFKFKGFKFFKKGYYKGKNQNIIMIIAPRWTS